MHSDRFCQWWRVGSKLGLAIFLAAAVSVPGLVQAKESNGAEATISLQALPEQARITEKLIRSGGPFPYAKDGVVFGNRERLLARKPRGYYREYTVPTPGARNRGARRIVCGGQPPTEPEACFYTADHYASFQRIVK